MTDVGTNYTLKVLNVSVNQTTKPAKLSVDYRGMRAPGKVEQPLESVDLAGIMKGCQAIAQRIFHDEWRLNNAVELTFTLADENGLALWHTNPTLYLKCPLTMSMKWSCLHLSDVFKTMTTLGIIELPDRSPLDGNSLDANKTAKVIMDAMANGVEFMGNIMLMRVEIDHDSAKRVGAPANRHH